MEPALDNPFWAFSLKVYDAPGVAEECLKLQERLGLDVNLLLFVAYLGAAEGILLAGNEVAAAEAVVTAWHGETVRGLRALRRALKPASRDESNPLRAATVALRTQLKTAELEAEKIEQAMLWRWSQENLASHKRVDARAALHSNLDEVLAHYGEPAGATDAELPHLQAAALVFA